MHIRLLRQIGNGSGGSVLSGTQNTKLKKKKHNKRQTDSSGTFVLESFIQKDIDDIHKLSYMYIVHVPCLVFIIPRYHWCEQLFAYLHCIIWSEQGHIFYILSLLCSDDAVIRFDIVWDKKKEAIKYSSMSKSDVSFCCKYHPLVLSLSHMWHIAWLYWKNKN